MVDISRYASIINKILPEESMEYKLILDSYSLLISALPTTSAQAHSRLSALDSYRPQLSSLVYMITDKWYRISTEYSLKYYKDYTRWSNAGTKPSHAAIEAQVYRDDPNLMMKKFEMDDLNNLLEFVKSLIKSLDNMRQSVMMSWKDSNIY